VPQSLLVRVVTLWVEVEVILNDKQAAAVLEFIH
jgi:hypothetical protein